MLTIQISRPHPQKCDLVRAKILKNALVPKNAMRITGIVHLTFSLTKFIFNRKYMLVW